MRRCRAPSTRAAPKPGDEVTATLSQHYESNGEVMMRRGTKLVGHVTEAAPRERRSAEAGGNSDSRLGIVFDKAVLDDGREVPINATIQAVAAAESTASSGTRGFDGAAVRQRRGRRSCDGRRARRRRGWSRRHGRWCARRCRPRRSAVLSGAASGPLLQAPRALLPARRAASMPRAG